MDCFQTVKGVAAKATGTGEFNAPANQLAAIKAKDFGKYVDPALKTVPVNLATLDITGGNSGSAALNAKGEFIGLAFDGTLDSSSPIGITTRPPAALSKLICATCYGK